MESRRLTMKNPGGRNYRLTCAVDTADSSGWIWEESIQQLQETRSIP